MKVTLSQGETLTSLTEFPCTDTSSLVSSLEKAKSSINTELTKLVQQQGAKAVEDLREEDMEVERDEDEDDHVAEQLEVVKPPTKKTRPSGHPVEQLQQLALQNSLDPRGRPLAELLDSRDELSHLRQRFHFPARPSGETGLYFTGNSLGLMPKAVRVKLEEDLHMWETRGVEGHFEGPRPWAHADDAVRKQMGKIVGALDETEVGVMNSLTVNLHMMLVPFYRPTPTRHKILMEKKSFPSDLYAVQTHVAMRGFDPAKSIVEIGPREKEWTIRTEDILDLLDREGDTIALVMFSGVQYYTGQWFEMEKITAHAQKKGCLVGWDLAHAVGNVPVQLHGWNVDWAVWCSYKYLNSGPGGVGGLFVHKKHHGEQLHRLGGWWGHKWETRFDMDQPFDPIPDAYGFRLSNAPVLAISSLLASVEIFDEATMPKMRRKSELLTGYLQLLLQHSFDVGALEIITPSDHTQRGCQLSLYWNLDVSKAEKMLAEQGVTVDIRKPNVMRIAPTPLYNSFKDVWEVVQILQKVVDTLIAESKK